MSVYRPKGSKIYWLDFMYKGERIRESTGNEFDHAGPRNPR